MFKGEINSISDVPRLMVHDSVHKLRLMRADDHVSSAPLILKYLLFPVEAVVDTTPPEDLSTRCQLR